MSVQPVYLVHLVLWFLLQSDNFSRKSLLFVNRSHRTPSDKVSNVPNLVSVFVPIRDRSRRS